MKLSVTGLIVAGLLSAAIATPAAAVMPAYIKLDGVDGESSRGADKPDRTAKPRKPGPERPARGPSVAVGDVNGDGRADSRKAGRRDVKPPSPKPTGLLLPAIQKGH